MMIKMTPKNWIQAVGYGILIAFSAHWGEAVRFEYNDTIAKWPVSVQTGLFFGIGMLTYIVVIFVLKPLISSAISEKRVSRDDYGQ